MLDFRYDFWGSGQVLVSSTEKDKLYLWLKDYDFVVILIPYINKRTTPVDNKVIIVTAFPIYPYRRRDFDKLLKKLSDYCKKQEVPVRTLQGLIIQHGTLTLLL